MPPERSTPKCADSGPSATETLHLANESPGPCVLQRQIDPDVSLRDQSLSPQDEVNRIDTLARVTQALQLNNALDSVSGKSNPATLANLQRSAEVSRPEGAKNGKRRNPCGCALATEQNRSGYGVGVRP